MKNSTYRLSLFQYVKFYYAIQHFCQLPITNYPLPDSTR